MVFSSLFVFVFSHCRPEEKTLEYWFHNRLDDDVELHLYFPPNTFNGKVNNRYMIATGDSVMLYSKTKPLNESSRGDLTNYIDSAKVNIVGIDNFVVVWRLIGDSDFAEGYEIFQDFYNWDFGVEDRVYYTVKISSNHGRSRFYLSTEEQQVN